MWHLIGGSDNQLITQSASVDNGNLMIGLPATQSPNCDRVTGLNHDTPHTLSLHDTAVGVTLGESDGVDMEMVIEGVRQRTVLIMILLAHEKPTQIADLDRTVSYPTPDSNPSDTPMLANKRAKESAEATPSRVSRKEALPPSPGQTPLLENYSFDQAPNNAEQRITAVSTAIPADPDIRCNLSASNEVTAVNTLSASEFPLINSFVIPGSQPSVEDEGHNAECHENPENAIGADNDFGVMEVQSDLCSFLQGTPGPLAPNLDVLSIDNNESRRSITRRSGWSPKERPGFDRSGT